MAALVGLAVGPVYVAAQSPPVGARLTYTKVLKGSVPEYEKVVVNADGSGEYDGHALGALPNPQPFHLTESTVQKFFRLAAVLHDFRGVNLESRKRVANLGLKTFEYESDGQDYRCQFNYSTNRVAGQLTNLFESVATVERHIMALHYAMRYDPLGLPHELTLIQIDLDNKSLVDPQLMNGALEKIANDPSVLHFAQLRARHILRQIQSKN